MRVKISGKTRALLGRRSDPDAAPGTLLGAPLRTCLRCGLEFAEDRMRTFPPGETPGSARVFLCVACVGGSDDGKDCGSGDAD